MDNRKQVEVLNASQWRGVPSREKESDDFLPLLLPFIQELDRARAWELRVNAEFCKWAWKQWEMRYVYRNIGDVHQKKICDVGGALNPLLRLFAMKGAICHMYDLVLPDTALTSQLAYDSLIQYERKDVCALDCPDNTFDVVYSISTFEHVANKRSALLEMVRVTKPGGLVICTCDAFSHDLDYQLEDPFFSNFPLNESAVKDLLGLSVDLPDQHRCWDFWKKDSVYMSTLNRWPDWQFACNGDYTSLGFVLRVKSAPATREEIYSDIGPMVAFGSPHSGRSHLIWGFYNADPNGGRFTRKTARLKLGYKAEADSYFYLRGFYPTLSRTTNNLHITIEGTQVASVPLMDRDQILDVRVDVPPNIVSGNVFVDLEVENTANVNGSQLGILVHECGFVRSMQAGFASDCLTS